MKWIPSTKRADMIADAVEKGHNFFIHDRGHLIGGELLGRAGGPVFVRRLDIQIPNPTLTNAHTGSRQASRDTLSPEEQTERRRKFEREYVDYAFDQNGLGKGDVLLLNSNSGYGFSAGVIAETAKEKGVKLIVMTSKRTGEKIIPEGGNKKIADYADILFDNHAPFGDAVFTVDGLDEKLWPASGMGAVYIGWPLVLAVTEKTARAGCFSHGVPQCKRGRWRRPKHSCCRTLRRNGILEMPPSKADKRRSQIVDLTNERGYITIEDLGSVLGVSGATLRTDLDILDGNGRLIRLRGVALSSRFAQPHESASYAELNDVAEYSAQYLHTRLSDEKIAIARQCLALFNKDDTIFLDTSNTSYRFAEVLVAELSHPLSVVTNSFDIFNVLRYSEQISPLFTGGGYDSRSNSVNGMLTTHFLGQLRANFAIITARGIHPQDGIRVNHTANTMVRQAMLANAEKTVIIADHSKFDNTGSLLLCDWDSVDYIVTDSPYPSHFDSIFASHAITGLYPGSTNL